jgi:GTP-binding protein LepA
MIQQSNIRNFCIIAHIDHGKSTLADRMLELTHTIPKRQMMEQVLDSMDIERERGITIKAQAVRMIYKAKSGEEHVLNLIDTPGHVDFSYEVSRSLAACEGALLVVDAVQGIEAQTIANAYLAIDSNLRIIPVINKIDLPGARADEVKKEIEEVLGIDASDALLVSAKTGQGVEDVLEKIIEEVPAPTGSSDAPLKALVFDSVYDSYRGVIAFVRIFEGTITSGQEIKMVATKKMSKVEEVGVLSPQKNKLEKLSGGEVGYVVVGLKDISDTKPGDTLTDMKNPTSNPLPGYREVKPMVFAGLYPLEGGDYSELRESLEKLKLNDPSFFFEPETSKALGFGFRCGFLGLLHLDVVKERLEREYGQLLLITTPSVRYRIDKIDGSTLDLNNPAEMPPSGEINTIYEPYVKAILIMPKKHIGSIMELCEDRRGKFISIDYLQQTRAQIIYRLPLAEILMDFFGAVKSKTQGHASFDYEQAPFEKGDLVRLDILIGGESIDALSMIVPRDRAYNKGKEVVERLREMIPRQFFEVAIQAAIGSKILARETVKAKRKDVLAKCYGGDITRKRKLLEKQKAGKKKMKRLGKVDVPQEAFLAILKVEEK